MTLFVRNKNALILCMGLSQLVGWGAMYYAYGVLMKPMQQALQLSPNVMVGAYSLALLISGALSVYTGRIIDRVGGRWLMSAGSLLASVMLALISTVHDVRTLYLAWAGLGIAMSATLYQSAFAVLIQVFRDSYRRAITSLTLIAGFSSTVAWPLTQAALAAFGWRHTWLLLALANLLVCLPVHLCLPQRLQAGSGTGQGKTAVAAAALANPPAADAVRGRSGQQDIRLAGLVRDPVFQRITIAITLSSLVSSALLLHLLAFLQSRGISAAQAVLIGAMLGPMQVLGRLLEIAFGRRATSSQVGTLAMWLAPLGLALLVFPTRWLLVYAGFALVYGLGNGVMTIVRGTLPVELYGRQSYGLVSGAMAMPVMFANAVGPFVASLLYTLADGYEGVMPLLGAISALAVCLFMSGIARATGVGPGLQAAGGDASGRPRGRFNRD